MNKNDKMKLNLQLFAKGPAEENLTRVLGTALSIDFTEQFGQRMKTLLELIGVQRQIPMPNGSVIKTYTSKVTLNGEVVGPGELIPLSEVKLEAGPTHELVWDKKRKAVPAEDIQSYGYERAILMTDTKLLNAVQKEVRTKLLAQLASGTGAVTAEGLQATMAQAWGAVTAKFDEDDVTVISFMNPFNAADYLATANITTQSAFGMSYIQDFLNNRVVFMSADIPKGTIYTTAVDNLILAYVPMNSSQVANVFELTADETGLIGVTHDINKQRLQAETITAYGMVLFAERLDGVVVGTITNTPIV